MIGAARPTPPGNLRKRRYHPLFVTGDVLQRARCAFLGAAEALHTVGFCPSVKYWGVLRPVLSICAFPLCDAHRISQSLHQAPASSRMTSRKAGGVMDLQMRSHAREELS